jgi:hypothetical protein
MEALHCVLDPMGILDKVKPMTAYRHPFDVFIFKKGGNHQGPLIFIMELSRLHFMISNLDQLENEATP